MRSIAGLLGFLVFLVIVWFAAGSYIDGFKAKMDAKCSEAHQALGLCK